MQTRKTKKLTTTMAQRELHSSLHMLTLQKAHVTAMAPKVLPKR
jgi:hypothetical protein